MEYRIAGGGQQENRLKQMVRELGLSKRVHFLGPLDQTEVIRQLQEADLFLLTSIREWLGMVLLEAQAIGLPVVATRVGGIPEAVDPDHSAVLVPPEDPQAAARALDECLHASEMRIRMGRAGRRHVENRFDVDNLNDTLVQIFRDLCRNTKRRTPEKTDQNTGRE